MGKKYPTFPILLVDDDRGWLRFLQMTVSSMGINNYITCNEGSKVLDIVNSQQIELIVLDLTMPDECGETILSNVVKRYPDIPVIILTSDIEVNTAVRCMQNGAFHYFLKSDEKAKFMAGIRHAIDIRELKIEKEQILSKFLSDKLDDPDAFKNIITDNRTMKTIFQYLESIAISPEPILITGETGTGKELIAQAIHKLSGLNGEFVPFNIAGEDSQIINDTLYGHIKGAFTGATTTRKGLVEEAKGGTLFLDEIGDLSMECQVKLLRLLQEKEYRPVGSDVSKSTDVRILAATNKNMDEVMEKGEFRSDLYYRLCAHHVHLPPLRERKEDIPLLLDYYLVEASKTLKKKKPTPPQELASMLQSYSFPGNIRELRAMVYDAVSRHESKKMSMVAFEKYIFGKGKADQKETKQIRVSNTNSKLIFTDELPTIKEATLYLVQEALRRTSDNKSLAAKMLDTTRQNINNQLKNIKTV